LIPNNLVEGILATQGYCDIKLNAAGNEVVSFTARTIPDVKEECRGVLVLSTAPTVVEGSSITAENSIEAPLHGLTLYGKTTQFTTTGKNLWSKGDVSVSSRGYEEVTFDTPLPAGTYAVSCLVTSTDTDGSISRIGFIGSDGAPNMYVAFERGVRSSDVVTLEYPYSTVRLLSSTIVSTSAGDTSEWSDIQIEVGSVATAYEPYTGGKPAPNPDYPQELEIPGNSGNIGVTVLGKNRANCPEELTFTRSTNLTIDPPLDPGTYTVSALVTSSDTDVDYNFVVFVGGRDDGENVYATLQRNTRNSSTVTIANQVSSIQLRAASSSSYCEGDTATFKQLQIEKGDTATEYEPYKGQTLTALTPNGLPSVPVESGGNYTDESGQQWACDEIDFAKGVYVQRVDRFTIDKATNLVYGTNSIGVPYLDIYHGRRQSLNKPTLSNGYIYISTGLNGTHGTIKRYERCYTVYDNRFTDKDNAIALLTEMSLLVLSVLDTPIETPLSAEELAQYAALHTNKPNTAIFNDSGAYMEVSYFTPNAAVPMNFGASKAGQVLAMDEHGCVTPMTLRQIGAAPSVESAEYPGCYYRIVNGVTEWINPPMMHNVEYRTTERWNGNVVYTKLIDLGTVPSGNKTIDIGVHGVVTGAASGLIRHYAFTNTGRSALSGGTTVDDWTVSVNIYDGIVSVTGGAGIGNNEELLYLHVWYIYG
jgi:methionine-rich copper-binding protein CopC